MQHHMDDILIPDARVNWGMAVVAGLISGLVVWLLSHGTPWFTSGLVSPTFMGRDLKAPGAVNPAGSLLTVVAHLAISICYALVIAALVSRFRAIWALGVGALVGLALYALNFVVFTLLWNVNWTGGELPVLVTHVVFALAVAGLYKGLARRPAVA
jgi:hypothetical protein